MRPPPVPPQATPIGDNDRPDLFCKPWWTFLSGIALGLSDRIQSGTWANLPVAATTQANSLYVVTDRGNAVYQLQGTAWVLVEGTMRVAQADIATLVLNANDAGMLAEVTDYRHTLRWSGAAWTWGPGEDGRHDIVGLPVDPDDLTGWQLCDGTTVAYLKGDGTTANFTTPDLTSAANKAAYLKLGTPVSGPNAAVAPTITVAGGTIAAAATGVTATTGTPSAVLTNITVTGAQQAGSNTHTHAVTVTDPTHTHTVSGLTGSAATNGEPRNYELRPWFRR